MDSTRLLHKLTAIGPRYAEKELDAAKIIEDELNKNNIKFTFQPFEAEVPVCIKATLSADGVEIKCLGSSLNGGAIPNGDFLISNIGYIDDDLPYNISYSPVTDDISVVDHYRVPSVTISRKDIIKIAMASDVSGKVDVERRKIRTENILVGNTENPENIVFAHFDSIVGNGAVDNAGSVVTLMNCIKNTPQLVENTLFVFAGNEEVSHDEYKISGYGFRVFEEKYSSLLLNSKMIVVLDGVGAGEPFFTQTGLEWVLQVKILDSIKNKVFWLQNDQSLVLQYFHAKSDTVDVIKDKFLLEAENLLTNKLTS